MPSAVLKDINGKTFSFAKLDAVNGIKLQLAIAKLVGSELADLAKAAQRADKADLLGEVGELLERVATKADPDEVVRLMSLVFSKATCNGRPIDINLTFGDNALEPWQAFVEGLKVNLGDFLAVVRSTSDAPPTPTQSP